MQWIEVSEGVDGIRRELITPYGLDVLTCEDCSVDAMDVFDVDLD